MCAYHIQPSAHGQGVFATRKIGKGETIIRESPLLEVPGVRDDIGNTTYSPIEAWRQLPSDDRTQFLLLHKHPSVKSTSFGLSPLSDTYTDINAVFYANFWNENGFGVVDRDGSRINHACFPNSYRVHRAGGTDVVYRATRDIFPGEEISISYLGSQWMKRTQRQEQLSRWEFTCTCIFCVDTVEGNEKERRLAAVFDNKELYDSGTNSNGKTPQQLHMLHQSVHCRCAKFLVDEKVASPLLAIHQTQAAKSFYALNNRAGAIKWGKSAVETLRICMGEDSNEMKAAKIRLEEFGV
ncbi:hypothetical protein Vi05172_g10852 [Venturia inaequalis]|nr:hypothetical protein Vi05172_g10852 [Venturia inaequalis]